MRHNDSAMKTFQEALRLFYRKETGVKDEEQAKKLAEKFGEEMGAGMELRESLLDEVMEDQVALDFVTRVVLELREPCQSSVVCVALHLFAHGVAVGVEMERNELDPKILAPRG